MGKQIETAETGSASSRSKDSNALLYRIDQNPHWLLSIVLGFQVFCFHSSL